MSLSSLDEENATDRDGLVWNVIHGTGAPKDCRVARLEQKLAQVKQLYELKYGADIESDDEDVQFDQDGTPWIETRGTGSPRDMRLERLEQMLGQVKGLYAAKYGRDVDIEHDADGTPWTVTEGTGVPNDCRVARLEQKLAQVKQLYELKYGAEIESDDEDVQFDQDGTPWIETRGTGSPRDMRLERLEQMLGDVKGLYAAKYGRDVDIEHDADGTPWTVTEGTGVPNDCRVARLEQKLAQVKQLYELKYGAEIESDDEDVQFDQDGTPWIETRGTGSPRDMRLERLEQMLGDVKGLYAAKYGRDVDIEHDADGTPWTVTEGTGVPRDCRVARLEQKLAQVKQLYELKYGAEIESDDEDVQFDQDGTPWIETRGTGSPRDMRLERLEQMLGDVKGLYAAKYGRDVDTEHDADGTPWTVTEGTGVPRDCRVARLEQKLAQVKQLYELKYGAEIESDDEDVQFDQDGTPWIETRGTGSPRDMRLERLEQMLGDVKGLYAAKYGRDVDIEHDADGTPWTVTEGTGVPRDCRVARLEQKLAQVKQLYELKYGAEIESDDEDVQFDQDGTPWIETRGTGSPRDMRLERLEQMLGDVKGLYAAKYGRDVDIEHDADGTPWTVTEGTGVPRDCRVARLEQKLAQVKQLYELKYGAEIESDDEDVQFDQDGTPWIETRGTGSPRDMRLERLEQMLGDVKGLYAAKYGRDVDIEHDADGTPWTVTEGTGVPRDCRVARLEQKLAQVKQLYELKYGAEIESDDEDVQLDQDGTPWIETRGTGSPRDMRLERLEQMLGDVKGLYAAKYGRDVDIEHDADGTPWTVTEGTGVPRDCRVARLEQKLAQVKQLYELKYGAEIESDDEDVQLDQDGTPWIETRGTGSPRDMRLERLEQMLGDVKGLYAAKYGRDVDIEHDADGTPWTVTEGTGVPRDCRVARLEQKLAQVKQLYELKYGAEIESDDEDVQFDQDGTPWIETRGTGSPRDMRLERLEQMLGDVKGLYAAKYGRDVDIEHDADGTPWTVTEGTGVPRDCRVARLEQKLAQVKQLYELKYGAEIESDDEDVQFDQDGTPWIETRGTGSPRDMRLERLEQMLGDVKGLYAAKYGRDVDIEHDADGTPWTVTEGTGVPCDYRLVRLEQKLAQVKQLYELKYGDHVFAAESGLHNVEGDFMYDADGTLWIRSITTGGQILC